MRTLNFPHFRAGYAIAACGIALAAICAYQAPGLMQAILVVGANAQLPLERLAAEAAGPTDMSTPVSATSAASSWKERTPAQARPAMQKLGSYGQPERNRRAHRIAPGYERSVTGFKYWT
ncbi:hypothetical protein J8I87_02855 [Paraburkholderia sp. LEh10]|nr:hypothetical protein [Paraburkholderia sp. LEh10]